MIFDATISEFAVCAIAIGVVFGPLVYAWADIWIDRTRSQKTDITKTTEDVKE